MSISSPVIKIGITASELIADDTLSTTARTVQHTLFDETITPSPATVFSGAVYALIAGAKTLDLRALRTVAGGSGDGNGLKVQGFYFKNLGANPMTIVAGASNGYLIFGTSGSVIVPAGGALCLSLADASADVDATHKTIDVSGTLVQTFEAAVILG
jgi:hypothetical protein